MKLTKKQKKFLDEVVNGIWSINHDTGFIDVDGNVDMSSKCISNIPVKFGNVTKNFNCSYNEIISIEQSPISVGGDFDCSFNSLKNLVGAPKSVGGNFDCSFNNLTSLEGAPQSVGRDFNCSVNELSILFGCPLTVGGEFNLYRNPITSLVGLSKSFNFLLISLQDISVDYYNGIIPQIEEMIESGIKIAEPDFFYYPYKEAYYNRKIMEII
jgi:hypothetical protein